MTERAGWQPDVLGRPFEQITLPLGTDAEGEVVATLVRFAPTLVESTRLHRTNRLPPLPPGTATVAPRRKAARGVDVLYVHGWSDYFFQRELAQFWHAQGARFFALDLRKYGRSLGAGQTPGFITDLSTYDQDIAAALDAMGHPHVDPHGGPARRPLILMGHSTGGLTLSLWAARHPGIASALVLNSPWLEFQAGFAGRAALTPLVDLRARVDPLGPMPQVDLGYYTRAVLTAGAWEYNLTWRPARGFPTHPAWLRAVLAGHAVVAAGLAIDAPVLTLLSAHSTILPRWSPAMAHSDSVLVVDDIARRSLQLGSTVTVARIDGALHDIFLSAPDARAAAYVQLARWLHGYLSR